MRDKIVLFIIQDCKYAYFSLGDNCFSVRALAAFHLSQFEIVLNNHALKSNRAHLGLDVRAYLKADLKQVLYFVVFLIVFVDFDQLLSVLPESERLHLFYPM